jgi:HD-GYP domain-containing protein (c-di-GMP phosphodiesterase class II)
MRKRVAIDEVRPGMFVVLSGSWLDHPFLRSSFRIESASAIAELRAHGVREVTVDFARSAPAPEPREQPTSVSELAYVSHNDAPPDPKDGPPPAAWNPQTLVSPALFEAIRDRRLSPAEKSRAVYGHTREMMQRLLDSPGAENIHAAKEAIRAVADLILADEQTARNLLQITSHDFYTYTHSVNVGVNSLMLAKALFRRSDAHDLHELGAGFFLHDLGKVKVDPAILNKPARLTEEEMRRMRIHPYQGYKILRDADALSEECRVIIMQHHELMDGNGYPRRVAAEEIHIYGRICCIADVFDALTAERSYKQAMKPFDALMLMKEKMPNHFDRALFAQFVALFRR